MTDIKELYNTVIKNDFCIGCGGCAVVNKNIKMQLNEYGEFKANVNLEENTNQNQEVSVLSVCPFSNESPNEDEISKNLYNEIHDIKYDNKLGYYKELYAGHVAEGDYRKNASSGGFGTWILSELFRKDLIDGVIHVKENNNKDIPRLFKFDISNSIEEIQNGAKTKYYPVEISEVISKVKHNPGRYAIIGIPCFIKTIRLLAKEDPIINERIHFTVGLICGGQKSSRFADSLAWQSGIKPGKLKSINFRKKLINAPADQYGVELIGEDSGEEVIISNRMIDLLGNNWGHGFFKSNPCDFCDDVMNETADITIGDAWLPKYSADGKGNNVVLVRNPIISNLLKEGIEGGRIIVDEISEEDIVKSQDANFRHRRDELGYRLYKEDYKGQWRPKKRVKATKKISISRRQIQEMRRRLTRESHISYDHALKIGDINYFLNNMEKHLKKYNKLYLVNDIMNKGPKILFKKALNKISNKS